MLSLVDYQRQVSAALTAKGEFSTATGPGLEVHHGTIFRALVNALQLRFPTIARLAGECDFERVASGYIRSHPPLSAVLYEYGSTFPAYLDTYSAVERYPHFPDVARFDLCIDRVSHFDSTTFGRTLVFAKCRRLRLSASLMCLQTSFPVDRIRDSLDAGRPAGLANLDMTPHPRYFTLWRGPLGTSVKTLSQRAALFLQAVLAETDVVDALSRSTGSSAYDRAAADIYEEIASNSFAQVARMSRSRAPRPSRSSGTR